MVIATIISGKNKKDHSEEWQIGEQMGLFNSQPKQTAEEKKQAEMQKFIQKYNIESLNPQDLEIVKNIASDLAGNGLMKTGMALSMAKAEDQLKVTYLSALVEQNWLIINQLSRLNDAVEKLANK